MADESTGIKVRRSFIFQGRTMGVIRQIGCFFGFHDWTYHAHRNQMTVYFICCSCPKVKKRYCKSVEVDTDMRYLI